MLRSSFSSFTSAQLAIRANQNALAVVGQNMANVNTDGYTRQRLDQISLNTKNRVSTYQGGPDAYIGYGVQVTGLSQIRDPFLDVRYRTEMSNIGTEDKKHNILDKINTSLDELRKNGALDDQLSDLFKQLATMSSSTKDKDDSLVRASAKTLTDMIRKYASQLVDVKNNLVSTTKEDVNTINDILDNIQKLNVSIKNSQVHGNAALELQDQRNVLIDQLATYVNIDVKHSTDVTLTGAEVDVLKIDMFGSGGERINLINDIYKAGKLTFSEPNGLSPNAHYKIDITDTRGREYPNTISNKGVFKSALEMLNGLGDYDTTGTDMGKAMGIGYYQKALDNLARTFAETFNDINTLPVLDANGDPVYEQEIGPDGKPLVDLNGDPVYIQLTDKNGNPLVDENGDPIYKQKVLGGSIFGTNDGTDEITAANITISTDWMNSAVHLLPSRDYDWTQYNPNDPASKDGLPPSSDLSNIDNFKNALTEWKLDYKTGGDGKTGNTIFTGTFQEFFTNIYGTAATEFKSTDIALTNYVTISNEIANSKDSVSGVSADDEVMDMMKYNNSLSAASRLMTTLDEALNTIINNMGVVGR